MSGRSVRAGRIGIAAAAAMAVSACTMGGLPVRPLPAAYKPMAAASAEQAERRAAAGEAMLAYVAPNPETPPAAKATIDALVAKYADHYDVPAALIHRVIAKESNYRPAARNGPNLGLMQIRYDTARSMGYRGTPEGLLDPDTNLRFAVKYLRGAYIVGGFDPDVALRLYQRGYYADAKSANLLEESGLL